MEEENYVVEIPASNIHFQFLMDGNYYALVSDSDDPQEGDEGYLVQLVYDGDESILARNIDSDELYKKVEKKFNRLMDKLGAEELYGE